MRFLLAVVLFAIFFAVANAITCYECDSINEKRCNEHFCPLDIKETDCDTADMPLYLKKEGRTLAATGCLTKIHESVNEDRVFIRRSCYFGQLENTDEACNAEDEYVPYANVLSCKVCTDDLCNTDAGRMLQSSKITLIAAAVACVGLYRIFQI